MNYHLAACTAQANGIYAHIRNTSECSIAQETHEAIVVQRPNEGAVWLLQHALRVAGWVSDLLPGLLSDQLYIKVCFNHPA